MVSPVTTIGVLAPFTGRTSAGLTVTVYCVIAVPPVLVGGVKAMLAWLSPAIAFPIVGALGTTGFTTKVWLTWEAASVLPLPAWLALTVQEPAVTKVNVLPLMVQTPVVALLKVTGKVELAVALNIGVVPKF